MSAQVQTAQPQRNGTDARDLQTKLYREIGISAVAAALRFTTQPEPQTSQPDERSVPPMAGRRNLAA